MKILLKILRFVKGTAEGLWQLLISEDFAMIISFIGGLLVIGSNQSTPDIGTNGGSTLVFGNPKYRFIVEGNHYLFEWGIFLVMFGFFYQMLIRSQNKKFFIIGNAIGVLIALLIIRFLR